MKIEIIFCNMGLMLIILFLLTVCVMKIATAVRGTRILNTEDHRKSNIAGFVACLVLFIVICVFTPVATGIFFCTGLVLIAVAAVLYILSITAFIKNKNGLTVIGIYAYSRNPMYVAMLIFLTGFILIALQSNVISAILLFIVTWAFVFLIHKRIVNEEKYLAEKYGSQFIEYKNSTARYISLVKYFVK